MRVSIPILALALAPLLGIGIMLWSTPAEPEPGPVPPVWVDDRGTPVMLSEPPERVVSLAPSLTEMMFTLGAGDRLVGRTRFAVAPVEAFAVPAVGGLTDVDLEAVVRLRPDLVVATDLTAVGVVDRLRSLGIPTASFRHDSVDDVLDDLTALAQLLGRERRGRQEASRLRDDAGAVEPLPGAPRVLVLLGPEDVFSPGPGTYAHEIVARSGVRQATDGMDTAWPRLSMEHILAFDPQVILIASGGSEDDRARVATRWEELRRDPAWGRLDAVANDRLVVVADSLLTIPGPRLGEAIHRVNEGLRHTMVAKPPSTRHEGMATERDP